MSWSKELKEYSARFWRKRRNALGELGEKADSFLTRCTEDERLLVEYSLATLPLSDLADYSFELLLGFARNALQARKEFSWCAALPEHIFLLYTAYPRINTEELADCRGRFHDALADRVRGLSPEEAILEVNRWCAQQVTYRSTDDRTASPLAVYRCGYGRCGEESTFAVTALRSVGIAARQVYAPWWSHCDDNHAWVEAYDGRNWRYFGACEPEPELDRGWFTGAASRAMMIHTRAFVQGEFSDFAFLFPNTDPADLHAEHGVACEAVTARYGATRPVAVTALQKDGSPAAGARVSFSVLNMADFHEIAVRKTGQDGTARLRLGEGGVFLSASLDGGYCQALIDTSKTSAVTLTLSRRGFFQEAGEWEDFDFMAPAGSPGYPAPLTPEKQKLRRECLDECAVLREQKASRSPSSSRESIPAELQRVLDTLTEKDLAGGVEPGILRDAAAAASWEKLFPKPVFEAFLLCPRIGLEPLRPWRETLAAAFSQKIQRDFQKDPQKIWEWMEKNIRETHSYPALCGTPAGAFRLKAANEAGRRGLFCALCRSLGIPARLSPLDGGPEYWEAGEFRRAAGEKPSAALTLRAPESQAALCRQNFSFCRWESNRWEPLALGEIPAGEKRELSLLPGKYRAVTVSRLPNGNQLARRLDFSLEAGERRTLALSFREGRAADMLECQALPPFLLESRAGEKQNSRGIFSESPFSLLLWLEVGREPTEHILNELRENASAFAGSGCAIHLVLEGPGQEKDPTLQRTLPLLSKAKIWYGDFRDTVPTLARRMFADPDKLPLILLIDRKGNGLYSTSGYNVGTAELLVHLLAVLDK